MCRESGTLRSLRGIWQAAAYFLPALAGVMVAETVNANCSFALGNFHLDPTHVKPVPFGLLRFMFEQAAFEIKEIRFSGPVPGTELEPLLQAFEGVPTSCSNYQDYAVIAVRR